MCTKRSLLAEDSASKSEKYRILINLTKSRYLNLFFIALAE